VFTSAPVRRLVGALIASTALGALFATSMVLPASAAETHGLTVSVRSVTGTPLSGVTVVAIAVENGKETKADLLPDGSYPKATAVTGKAGVYRFADLADVDHTFYFSTTSATAFSQLLGGASDIAQAEVVPAAQETLSVSLATNAVISGTVKSASAKAMNKAYVSAYRYTGSGWELYSTARTDSHGKYKLTDIDPGSYRLKFQGNGGTYPPMYSGGGAKLEGATTYSVGVGSTTTVNAAFPKGTGTISGSAKVDYQGYQEYGYFGMAKAQAFAIPVTVASEYPNTRTYDYDAQVASELTGKSGAYSIKNLPAGTYVVKVVPWYYNQSTAYVGYVDLTYARLITVVAGKTSSGNTAYSHQTDDGAALTVRVRAANGGAYVANADVLVQNDVYPDYFFAGTTDALGAVTFGVQGTDSTMQTGSYSVTVTSSGAYAPLTSALVVHGGQNYYDAYLSPPAMSAGFVAAPSISETALAVGTRYVVSAQAKRTTAKLSYQWMRDGRPIWGADDAAYTSTDGDVGKQLSVHVSSYQFGYPVDEADASVAGLIVSDESAPTVTTAPSITPLGEAHVGTVLHALPGAWSVHGLSYAFQWYRDGIPFENSGDSYTVTLGDLDSEFTVAVTASKAGHPDATASTPTGVTPVFAATVLSRSGVVVSSTKSGVSKGSLKFTAKPGTWTAPAAAFAYEWWRGGVKVADGATLVEKQNSANRGAPLEVHVTATAAGFGDGSAVVLARKASAALQRTATPVATVDGVGEPLTSASSIMFGHTVQISAGTWAHGADDLGTVLYSYQWIRKVGSATTKSISGATAATYTPTVADIGAKLSVKVSASSSRWASASAIVAVGSVVKSEDLVTSVTSLNLTGPAVTGVSLRAPAVTEWVAAGAVVSYQWYACVGVTCTEATLASKYTKISGATYTTWSVPTTYADGRVFVTITATKAGSSTARVSTPSIIVAPLKQIVVLARPVINSSNLVAVGYSQSATTTGFSTAQSVTRAWEGCFADCLSEGAVWVAATGTTNTYNGTFVPSASMWADGTTYIRVVDTATRDTYVSATAYSDPVPMVKGLMAPYVISSYSSVSANGTNSWKASLGINYLTSFMTMGVQWFVGGELRGTGLVFTATDDDAGKPVSAVRTFTATGYQDFQVGTQVRAGATSLVTEKSVTIVGGQYGGTLSVSDPFPWDVPDTPYAQWTVRYAWVVGNSNRGSAMTITPTAADVGSSARVLMTLESPVYGTFTRQVYLGGVLNGATIQPGPALELDSPVVISWGGDLLPGTPLTASAPSYAIEGVSSTYSWQRSADGSQWTDISGATSPTYTVALIDSTRQLRVVVTSSKAGHATISHASDPVQVLEGDVIRVLAAPVLFGDPRVGSTLTIATGSWTTGATPYIQWLLNGRAIPGATKSTYVPLALNVGDEISVRVTGKQSGRLDVVAETSAVTIARGAAPTVVTAPVISGTSTLTATPGVWTVSGLTFSYEWTLDGVVVSTTDTVVLLPDTTKADYTLTVRATRNGYEAGQYTTP
jgi:hypothetical protein